jgi:hypothetical protein
MIGSVNCLFVYFSRTNGRETAQPIQADNELHDFLQSTCEPSYVHLILNQGRETARSPRPWHSVRSFSSYDPCLSPFPPKN